MGAPRTCTCDPLQVTYSVYLLGSGIGAYLVGSRPEVEGKAYSHALSFSTCEMGINEAYIVCRIP